MNRKEIEKEINNILHEFLFAGFRQEYLNQQRSKLQNSTDYKMRASHDAKALLDQSYQKWFDSLSKFFLSYRSLFAVVPLVLRELQIREFQTNEVFRVKADYNVNGIEFSGVYPAHFNAEMKKEIDDCIEYLMNPKYQHRVDSFVSITDTEKQPPYPLTTAELKYSCFYLFGFEPEYVTKISSMLFQAGLITNPKTSGWAIQHEIIEDMITVLNQVFSESKVLQYQRQYPDPTGERMHQECIRPTKFAQNYFPKSIKNTPEFIRMTKDKDVSALDVARVYELIFYITLSTQMTNSIYDTSRLEIAVGDKILKEEANIVIEGQENWEELAGNMLRKIANSANQFGGQTVVIPELAPETVIVPLDVYSYSYNSRRPPRYGVGRFLTQILERYSIGKNDDHDLILNELISSKSVVMVKNMLIPQENIISLVSWFQDHMNFFMEISNLSELEAKVDDVAVGNMPLRNLIDEIEKLIQAAFDSAGIDFADKEPSQGKLKLLKLAAKTHNITIDPEIYQSEAKVNRFLAEHPLPEPIRVGRCPACNAEVQEKEFTNDEGETFHYFSCENYKRGCNFSLSDRYVYNFFSQKEMELFNVKERREALQKVLSKKGGYLFTGFVNKSKRKYDAKVYPEEYLDNKTGNDKWHLAMKFTRR